MLFRLVYCSENHLGASDGKMVAGLNDILAACERNNRRDDITGALLFDTLWFIQILEGERQAVSKTLRRILADERHSDLTVMDARPAERRLFANWWMGVAMLRGGEQDLLSRHGLSRLDPRVMTGDTAIAIAADLAGSGLQRRLAPAAA